MLRETRIDRREGELTRRWYLGSELDLITWCSERGELEGFQITYRRSGREKALTWKRQTGFTHDRVDEGEGRSGRYKMTPTLDTDRSLDRTYLLSLLAREAVHLDPELIAAISSKVREYPLSVGEYVQARWGGKIEDPLWLGWDPVFAVVSVSAVGEYVNANRNLPGQILELLGAWTVLLCLRESRWAPSGSIVESTADLSHSVAGSFSPDSARAVQSGIDAACDRLRSIEHEPAAVVDAATAYFTNRLHDRLRE